MLINKLRRRTLFGRKKKHSDGGFTLVELLVVITILGILAAVVVFAVSGIGDKGHATASATDLRILQTAEEAACAYAPPPNTPIGPNSPPSDFEDTPQLLRDGFLASIGQYNDVELNAVSPTATCTGSGPNTGINTTSATWTPQASYGTVNGIAQTQTITDCNGIKQTFTKRPQKVLVNDPAAYPTLLNMGLAGIAYVSSTDAQYMGYYLTQAQLTAAAPYLFVNGLTAPPAGPNVLPAYSTSVYAASADPAFLASVQPDLIFEDYAGFLLPTGSSESGYVTEQSVQAEGYATYVGYALDGEGGSFHCTNTPTNPLNTAGQPIPVKTLEGLFQETRDLGTIFDVQAQAQQLNSAAKAAMGAALVAGKAAIGTRTVTVGAINAGTLQYGSYCTTPTGCLTFEYGDQPVNAAITSAGGTPVFQNYFPTAGTNGAASNNSNTPTVTELQAANPAVLVLLDDVDSPVPAGAPLPLTTTPGCQAAVTALTAAGSGWAGVPAVTNQNYICLAGNAFEGYSAADIPGIVALTNLIAKVAQT